MRVESDQLNRSWTDGEAQATYIGGRLSVFAKPSLTRDDGAVAVGIEAPWIAELMHRAPREQRGEMVTPLSVESRADNCGVQSYLGALAALKFKDGDPAWDQVEAVIELLQELMPDKEH